VFKAILVIENTRIWRKPKMGKAFIIHENNEWTEPLRREMKALGVTFEEWFLDQGLLDLSKEPPQGVFYNRMSASSHTRDHRFAPEYTAGVIAWLEGHGRRVINTGRALQLEISKIAQYSALNAMGIRTPKTLAAIGKENIVSAASDFIGPFITKHNRAGKGLGVQLFQSIHALECYVNSSEFELPIDGITLLQEYIQAPEPVITRCEFVGGKFLYAVQVDTSKGFQLCPADACQIGDAFCPVGKSVPDKPKFKILKEFDNPIIEKYERFIRHNGIQIAGIEFIVDNKGEIFTYDVNTNTNYNSEAEEKAGLSGMGAIARYLMEELEAIS
jgi:glutathione synthase/RimK-type ligase-like ATP-grasp enzyme